MGPKSAPGVHDIDRHEEVTEGEFDPLEMDGGADGAPWASYFQLHLWYSAVVLVLIATGITIQFPDLRAAFIGGYGRLLATVHEWAGVVMLAVPLVAVASAPSRALETIRIRSFRTDNLRFHAFNLWFTLVSGVVFIVSGFVLWFQMSLPYAVVDLSTELHVVFSYGLYAVIPLHIIAARERIFAVFFGWARALRGLFFERRGQENSGVKGRFEHVGD
ncbi:MAG: cytochrome b/b6 domain-containing protein [Candidatus Binatia bacterium]